MVTLKKQIALIRSAPEFIFWEVVGIQNIEEFQSRPQQRVTSNLNDQ
jgi:hypothetical protein